MEHCYELLDAILKLYAALKRRTERRKAAQLSTDDTLSSSVGLICNFTTSTT